jgi:uncharacterized protein YwqG
MTTQSEGLRLFESGKEALEAEDYDKALKLLSMSLSYERRAEAYFLKAQAQMKKNDFKKAIDEAEDGLGFCSDQDDSLKNELSKFLERCNSLLDERNLQLEEFKREISEHKEEAIKGTSAKEFAKEYKKPSLRMHSVAFNGSRSRFKGDPLVPENFEWPIRADGTKLSFLCQIDFAETAKFEGAQNELPSDGMLSFFYDVDGLPSGCSGEDKDGSKVFYFSKDVKLEAYPDENGANEEQFSVQFIEEPSYPDPNSTEGCTLNESSRDEYLTFWENYCDSDGPHHALVGHPEFIQYDYRESIEVVIQNLDYRIIDKDIDQAKKVFDDSRRWKLLLQLDSDEKLGFEWGDGGRLYFSIDEQALKNANFSNVWVEMQCT